MTDLRLVDPQLLPLVEAFPDFRYDTENLAATRLRMIEFAKASPIPNVPVALSELVVPGSGGRPDVGVMVYRPLVGEARLPGYLHIHGGGYIAGHPVMSDARNRLLAHSLQCVVISVDYRLAPETPQPGPVEDCYAALLWAYHSADELGIDPGRLAIGGESAGGGLAAALALVVRDRAEVPVLGQMLVYPMLDDRTCVSDDRREFTGNLVWDRASNYFGWSSYLGMEPGSDNVPAYAAPARADSLAGLPFTFIAVGQLDLFADENLAYARRLIAEGVLTELHLYPGAFHGFDMLPGTSSSDAFLASFVGALKRLFRCTD